MTLRDIVSNENYNELILITILLIYLLVEGVEVIWNINSSLYGQHYIPIGV